jgi:hypothetical protein
VDVSWTAAARIAATLPAVQRATVVDAGAARTTR